MQAFLERQQEFWRKCRLNPRFWNFISKTRSGMPDLLGVVCWLESQQQRLAAFFTRLFLENDYEDAFERCRCGADLFVYDGPGFCELF